MSKQQIPINYMNGQQMSSNYANRQTGKLYNNQNKIDYNLLLKYRIYGMKPWNIALSIIFLGISLIIFYHIYKHDKLMKNVKDMTKWRLKSYGATIISSKVRGKLKKKENIEDAENTEILILLNNNSRKKMKFKSNYEYDLVVKYKYEDFNGKNFTNDKFYPDFKKMLPELHIINFLFPEKNKKSNIDIIKEKRLKYLEGNLVDMYYNVSNAKESYLEQIEESKFKQMLEKVGFGIFILSILFWMEVII
jgi:hypothetical protein